MNRDKLQELAVHLGVVCGALSLPNVRADLVDLLTGPDGAPVRAELAALTRDLDVVLAAAEVAQ